jgi:hypothetical protein
MKKNKDIFNLINEKYNWEKIAEKTFEVYKSKEI